jgi:hypothetical protein
MKMQARVLVAGVAVLALGFWSLARAGRGLADEKGDVRSEVQKLTDTLEKGNADQAAKLAQDIAKSEELEDVMNLMALRKPAAKKQAFGYGAQAGIFKPDGIEAQLQGLGKRALPARVAKEADDISQLAYRVAAISKVAQAKPPEKDEGMKTKAKWMEWSKEMESTALQLADAAKQKNAKAVKAAAAKLNENCNNCHGVFRD